MPTIQNSMKYALRQCKANSGAMICSMTLFGTLWGCAPLKKNHSAAMNSAAEDNSFQALLRKGLGPNYGETEETEINRLASRSAAGTIVELERDLASDVVNFIAYDESSVEAVDGAKIPAAARAYLEAHGELLGVSSQDLVEEGAGVVRAAELASIQFQRTHKGMPVKDAVVQLLYRRHQDGRYRLSMVQNRSFGAVDLASNLRSMSDHDALALTGIATMRVVDSEPIVYPKLVDRRYEMITARSYQLEDSADPGITYRMIVDTTTGQMLEAWSDKFEIDRRVSARVYDRGAFYGDRIIEVPLANVKVGEASTDADGVLKDGPSSSSLSFAFSQNTLTVRDAGQSKNIVSFKVTAGGEQVVVTQDDAPMEALNAHAAINRVVKWVGQYLDTSDIAVISKGLTVMTNVSGKCNAFYIGRRISLFQADGGCANMGLVNDVIYHEWGHGLDDSFGGIEDGAFSEGIGDIVSAYMVNDSNMAPGFYVGRERGIRNLKNKAKVPPKRQEVHVEGLVIGGAFWDMREALIKRYGQENGHKTASKLFLNHLKVTSRYRNSYRAVLALDGGATNSPNHCLINKAFAAHGLATDENCTDAASDLDMSSGLSTPPPVDPSVRLAISAADASGNLQLWGASNLQESFAVCTSDVKTCAAKKRIDLRFTRQRTKGNLALHKADALLKASSGQVLTLITLATDGSWKSARAVSLIQLP